MSRFETLMDETILKAETVKLMTSPQTASLYTSEELENRDSYYGYGWSVNGDGLFFHTGSDGTAVWVDPNNELIVLVFTQSPGATSIRSRFVKLVQVSIYRKGEVHTIDTVGIQIGSIFWEIC